MVTKIIINVFIFVQTKVFAEDFLSLSVVTIFSHTLSLRDHWAVWGSKQLRLASQPVEKIN